MRPVGSDAIPIYSLNMPTMAFSGDLFIVTGWHRCHRRYHSYPKNRLYVAKSIFVRSLPSSFTTFRMTKFCPQAQTFVMLIPAQPGETTGCRSIKVIQKYNHDRRCRYSCYQGYQKKNMLYVAKTIWTRIYRMAG